MGKGKDDDGEEAGQGMTKTPRSQGIFRLASRMLPSDALFWYVGEATPELRPVVAGLFLLDRAPDHERARRAVQCWLARVPRLRQHVVEAPLRLGLPEWEDDPHFELDYHVRNVILPEPATDRHLFDFLSTVFATPLDPMRPLWEVYLIEGLDGGRAAGFFKVHHCVMDGVGSVAGFDALTQARRDDPIRIPRRHRPHPPRHAAVRGARLLRDTVNGIVSNTAAVVETAVDALLDPAGTLDLARRAVRGVGGMLRDVAKPGVHDPLADPGTGIGRRLDGITLSLPRLRKIKDGLGVTLNDVVLAAVAGAVGRYHEHRKVHVVELHCMVPMNLRLDEESHALGNRVGMCNVALPVGEADPSKRLALIHAQTSAAKSDRRGAVYPFLMRALAFTPRFAFRWLAQSATEKINLICTNVPGPREERFFAGGKVEKVFPFAPIMIGTPLSIALLSYADQFGVGIATDPAAIPDPERLHRYLDEAFTELEAILPV